MLEPVSRPCIRTAFVLYGGILDAVAEDGYAVLHRRSVVPRRRRAVVAADGLARVAAARLRARQDAARRPDGVPLPGTGPVEPRMVEEVA
jgi:phytoene synthase